MIQGVDKPEGKHGNLEAALWIRTKMIKNPDPIYPKKNQILLKKSDPTSPYSDQENSDPN